MSVTQPIISVVFKFLSRNDNQMSLYNKPSEVLQSSWFSNHLIWIQWATIYALSPTRRS